MNYEEMYESKSKFFSLLGDIKLRIDLEYYNGNPHMKSEFEATLYLVSSDGMSFIIKNFNDLNDLFSYLCGEAQESGEQVFDKMNAFCDEIEADFDDFEKQAQSNSRQEQYYKEADENLADMNREFWATR